jgi:GNAT superfamily N-acetyltransferase
MLVESVPVIRDATIHDIPRLVSLGYEMHQESERFRKLEFDADRLAETLQAAIVGHFAKVVERNGEIVGGLVALLVPHWASRDLTACDLALFMTPGARGTMSPAMLLAAYRQWAKKKGSVMTLFGVMTGVNVEQTVAMCERLGWRRAGVVMEA